MYSVCSEGASFLNSVKGNIGVISIAGKYRTGKSFFLNRCVLNAPCESGFVVGSTIQACTKGIWLYTRMVECERDGTKFTVVVLDTEGIGALDANSTHDSRIFALSLLLSSYFIYNSVGSIDENAVGALSLVSNISKHVRVNSGDEPSTEELGKLFPSFLWVVRDFTLRLVDVDGNSIDTSGYLEAALEGDDDTRRTLRSSFPNRRCVTMVRPCVDEGDLQLMGTKGVELRPAFVEQMDEVRGIIWESVPQKKVMGRNVNGGVLCALAESYVNAINDGVAPVIKDSWALLTDARCRQHMEDATERFDTLLSKRGCVVTSHKVLGSTLGEWILGCMSQFEENSKELASHEYRDKLREKLEKRRHAALEANDSAVKIAVQGLFRKMDDSVADITSLGELERICNMYTMGPVAEMGDRASRRWALLISQNVWSWVRIVGFKVPVSGDGDVGIEAKMGMLTSDFEKYRESCDRIVEKRDASISELQERIVRYKAEESRLLGVLGESSVKIQRLEICNTSLGEDGDGEKDRTIARLHGDILKLNEDRVSMLHDAKVKLEVALSENASLHGELSEMSLLVDERDRMVAEYRERVAKLEERDYDASETERNRSLRQDLVRAEGALVEMEREHDARLAELCSSTESEVDNIRKRAVDDRNKHRVMMCSLESALRESRSDYATMGDMYSKKAEMLESRIQLMEQSEVKLVRLHEKELCSVRAELHRSNSQWEQQNQSTKEMVGLLEGYWKDDVANKTAELAELKDSARVTECDLTRRLKEAESDLVCSQVLLKENKRRLTGVEERADAKRARSCSIEMKLADAVAGLGYMKKKEAGAQNRIRELEIENMELGRKYKDMEFKNKVDILEMKLHAVRSDDLDRGQIEPWAGAPQSMGPDMSATAGN